MRATPHEYDDPTWGLESLEDDMLLDIERSKFTYYHLLEYPDIGSRGRRLNLVDPRDLKKDRHFWIVPGALPQLPLVSKWTSKAQRDAGKSVNSTSSSKGS